MRWLQSQAATTPPFPTFVYTPHTHTHLAVPSDSHCGFWFSIQVGQTGKESNAFEAAWRYVRSGLLLIRLVHAAATFDTLSQMLGSGRSIAVTSGRRQHSSASVDKPDQGRILSDALMLSTPCFTRDAPRAPSLSLLLSRAHRIFFPPPLVWIGTAYFPLLQARS